MPKYRRVDAMVMERPARRTPKGRTLTPEQEALVKRMKTLTDASVVYEATLEEGEKPATVRQQLKAAAKRAGVEIAVKKSPSGFYFGLLTPERRTNRGRKPASPAGS